MFNRCIDCVSNIIFASNITNDWKCVAACFNYFFSCCINSSRKFRMRISGFSCNDNYATSKSQAVSG